MDNFVAKWLKLSLVVIMGCGFLAMMIYALLNKDQIRSSEIEPPLITPPSEPLKRRPDQPGGMQIPNRDKLVFDLLDSSSTRAVDENVPPLEQPVSATQEQAAAPVSGTLTEAEMPKVQPVVAPAAAVKAEPVKVVEAEPAPVAKVEEVKPAVEPKPAVVAEVKPEAKVEPKKEEAKPVAKEEAVTAKVAKGTWGVQLAAVNTVADGKALAAKAAKQFPDLAKLKTNIQPVPGGGKYRVQFFGVDSRDAAAKVCAKMAGKQGCFPVSSK